MPPVPELATSPVLPHLPKKGRCGAPETRSLGWAWLAFSSALALHVTDEALTGFLSVYNPTVLALRTRLGWWPMPTFQFGEWLVGLIVLVCVLFAVSPLFFRGNRAIRIIAWPIVVLAGIGNGLGHITGTILGRTVSGVTFPRPMPGFWSAPVLIAAAVWVIVELKRSAHPRSVPMGLE